ncbi:MAG: Gfo/Idh/MocA family oxidoreductase [Nitrososphaeria archaeon]|jgi:predicted dehydrogenase
MEVLVLGCRGFGRIHIDALKKLDVEVSAFARTEEALEECSKYAKLKKSFTDIDEALNSPADVVDIILPHSMHKEVAIKALKKGKHVIVEKPIATTVQDAWEMIKTAKEMKRKFMVAEQFFFDPSVKVAKKLIEEGKIGKVHSIIMRDQMKWNVGERWYGGVRGGWRLSKKEMGGGNLIDGGIHFMDTFLNLGGEYKEVKAFTYKTGNILEGEDETMALFRFKSGAYGMFYHSWDYPYPPLLPRFEVVGDVGSIVEDARSRKKRPYGSLIVNGKLLPVKDVDLHYEMLKGFITSIKEDSEVPFPPELEVRDLEGIMAIYSASNSFK